MAYVVEPPDTRPSRAKTIARYPWHEWTDGQWWQAVRGEDYTITDDGFRSCLYSYASLKGLRGESRKNDEGVMFRFQPKPGT